MADKSVEVLDDISGHDLHDLCDAAESAIIEGGGFGWISVPPRQTLETYWRGVLLVPERTLFVGRLDGVIAGSAQLIRPTKNNEAQSHACDCASLFLVGRISCADPAITPSNRPTNSVRSGTRRTPRQYVSSVWRGGTEIQPKPPPSMMALSAASQRSCRS